MSERNLVVVLERLYASEINCGLDSFWDAGWRAWIGDDANGREREEVELGSMAEVAEWLHRTAIERYPDSAYAKANG